MKIKERYLFCSLASLINNLKRPLTCTALLRKRNKQTKLKFFPQGNMAIKKKLDPWPYFLSAQKRLILWEWVLLAQFCSYYCPAVLLMVFPDGAWVISTLAAKWEYLFSALGHAFFPGIFPGCRVLFLPDTCFSLKLKGKAQCVCVCVGGIWKPTAASFQTLEVNPPPPPQQRVSYLFLLILFN